MEGRGFPDLASLEIKHQVGTLVDALATEEGALGTANTYNTYLCDS
jgi:hypothetical protein